MSTTAIVGIGEVVRPEPMSSLDLHVLAAQRALDDAGLTIQDIDGLVVGYSLTEPKMVLSAAVAEYMGLCPRFIDSAHVGGAAPYVGVANAASAVNTGQAERVLVVFGDNRRTGWADTDAAVAAMISEVGHPDYELPFGPLIPASLALVAQRHMYEYGTTREQLAMIPVIEREHAILRGEGERLTPLTVADVLAAKPVATPLVNHDCALVSDTAGAIVVARADDDRVRHDVTRVRIAGTSQFSNFYYPFQAPSLTSFGFSNSARVAFEQAGWTTDDIDVAEIYDAFSIIVLIALEDLGFCEKGGGGAWVEKRQMSLGGAIPVNTHGGLLSYAGNGVFHITEAVKQLRHAAGSAQVADARRALATGYGGMVSLHCTLLLERMEP